MQICLHLKCKRFLWGAGEMVLTELMFTQELFTSGLKWRIYYTAQLFYSCNHFPFRCTLFRVHRTWFKSFRFSWAPGLCLIEKERQMQAPFSKRELNFWMCYVNVNCCGFLSKKDRTLSGWLRKVCMDTPSPVPSKHTTHTHPSLFSGSRS